MGAHEAEVRRALRHGQGVIARRDHPALVGVLDGMVRRGRLVPVLPGVYCPPERRTSFNVRVQAAARWEPDVVFTGATAARLTYWPELRVDPVTAALPRRRETQQGYRFHKRVVPPDLVCERDGLRFSTPALAALDLSDSLGGDAIDVLLRTRQATLGDLHEALSRTPGRAGNDRRRRLLLESKDAPWSAAERRGHVLLRGAGITGWRANHPVEVHGALFFLDVAFPAVKVAVEFDGYEHHSGRGAFERDRDRQNALVLAGWRVLRFTWAMLVEHPEQVVAQIRAALAS